MSNIVIFTGRVAKAPELTRPSGSVICRFSLIRNESRGRDAESGEKRDERVVSVQFTAFDGTAEAISEHVLAGDQLIITARIENNNFTDKDGGEHYGFNFVVQNFEFGAPGKQKRDKLDAEAAAKQRG